MLLCIGLLSCTSTASDALAQRTSGVNGVSIKYCASQLGNAKAVSTRTFNARTFQRLHASTAVDVVYTPGTSQQAQVKVTATREYADYLVAEVSNNALVVYWDTRRLERDFNRKKFDLAARVEVTAPSPSNIHAESGACIRFTRGISINRELNVEATRGAEIETGSINCTSLRASASSGASFEAKTVRCLTAYASASSGGEMEIDGLDAAQSAKLECSSGSELKAENMRSAGSVKAEVSSGASITLSGKTESEIVLAASSGAELDASALQAPSSQAEATSGGSVKTPKTKELRYKENSGGDVSWKGTPKVTKMK